MTPHPSSLSANRSTHFAAPHGFGQAVAAPAETRTLRAGALVAYLTRILSCVWSHPIVASDLDALTPRIPLATCEMIVFALDSVLTMTRRLDLQEHDFLGPFHELASRAIEVARFLHLCSEGPVRRALGRLQHSSALAESLRVDLLQRPLGDLVVTSEGFSICKALATAVIAEMGKEVGVADFSEHLNTLCPSLHNDFDRLFEEVSKLLYLLTIFRR